MLTHLEDGLGAELLDVHHAQELATKDQHLIESGRSSVSERCVQKL